MEEVEEFVDYLEKLWKKDELTEFAYQISQLYASSDYSLISDAMIEFKKRIKQ
jgi:hypothetical protein